MSAHGHLLYAELTPTRTLCASRSVDVQFVNRLLLPCIGRVLHVSYIYYSNYTFDSNWKAPRNHYTHSSLSVTFSTSPSLLPSLIGQKYSHRTKDKPITSTMATNDQIHDGIEEKEAETIPLQRCPHLYIKYTAAKGEHNFHPQQSQSLIPV